MTLRTRVKKVELFIGLPSGRAPDIYLIYLPHDRGGLP